MYDLLLPEEELKEKIAVEIKPHNILFENTGFETALVDVGKLVKKIMQNAETLKVYIGNTGVILKNAIETTTGRPRRCGWFDCPNIISAILPMGLDVLCLNHIDTIGKIGNKLGYICLTNFLPIFIDKNMNEVYNTSESEVNMIKDNLLEILHEMEDVTKLFKLEPFEIYIIGGSACILGEYTTRATLDIDFVDLGYPAKYGKVFTLLRDYDMLEFQSTILSPNYKKRALKLEEFKYINVFVLSKEDIAISKIIRLANKDIEDLDEIIPKCNKELLNMIIDEVLNREDLFESKRNEFIKKLEIFREKYNV